MKRIKSALCTCLCPFSIITAPPYWARAWLWTHQACLAHNRVLQVMHARSSFARRKGVPGLVHTCTRPSGARADEGPDGRGALKNVKGFWDETQSPHETPWSLTPACWPLCFVLWPQNGAYMWGDTDPKVSLQLFVLVIQQSQLTFYFSFNICLLLSKTQSLQFRNQSLLFCANNSEYIS